MKIVFNEKMSGTIYFKEEGIWQAEFVITAVSDAKEFAFLKGKFPFEIKGHLRMNCVKGCCKVTAPLQGYLTIDVLNCKLNYDFVYEYCRGVYSFRGEKNVKFGSITQYLETMTYLPGHIFDSVSGKEIADAEFYFNLKKDLVSLMTSFRVRF
jgi:hypothetical protein